MAGVGGQGIILASDILAEVMLEGGFDVKKSEIHGMAQRGGSVSSHIRFGEKVYSPTIPQGSADYLICFEKYSLEEVLEFNLPYKNIPLLYQTWKKELNTPKSSSVGRLFDGVASLAKLCDFQSYEGEAGLLTEWKMQNGEWRIEEGFSYKIANGVIEIEWDFFDKL